jgi:hypothetical protein
MLFVSLSPFSLSPFSLSFSPLSSFLSISLFNALITMLSLRPLLLLFVLDVAAEFGALLLMREVGFKYDEDEEEEEEDRVRTALNTSPATKQPSSGNDTATVSNGGVEPCPPSPISRETSFFLLQVFFKVHTYIHRLYALCGFKTPLDFNSHCHLNSCQTKHGFITLETTLCFFIKSLNEKYGQKRQW